MTQVVDAPGGTNTLSYNNGSYPNHITGITDAYGRTASLDYDANGLLDEIQDTGGLTSTFTYEENDWVETMTTPYGQTTFTFTDSGSSDPSGRSVRIADPVGGTNLFYNQSPLALLSSSYATNMVPATTNANFSYSNTFDNSELDYRNSFHWGPRQFDALNATFLSSLDFDDLGTNDLHQSTRRHHFLQLRRPGPAERTDLSGLRHQHLHLQSRRQPPRAHRRQRQLDELGI